MQVEPRSESALFQCLKLKYGQLLSSCAFNFNLYPYTEGRDHIFVFPTERGPALLSEANLMRIHKSIFITGMVDRDSHGFSSWKDIVVPPVRVEDVTGASARSLGASNSKDRSTLLHFRGIVPG